MVAARKPQFDDNTNGTKRAEKRVATPRDITPISTPLAQREPPLEHPAALTRIPRAPIADISDVPTTQLPRPTPEAIPIPEFTRDGKTSYLLHKHIHSRGGYVEYSAVLGSDGGGTLWWQDTDWNHGGLSVRLSFDIIANLYAAAVDARRTGCGPIDPDREGA